MVLSLRALGAVLGTSLLAVGDADRVERSADHVIANSRQVLDAPAADHHDRVFLEVVADARNVGRDFDPVGQAHARDLAQRRVRLLRRRRVDARADAALLRRALQRGRSRLHRERARGPSGRAEKLSASTLLISPSPPEPWKDPRSTVNALLGTGRVSPTDSPEPRGKTRESYAGIGDLSTFKWLTPLGFAPAPSRLPGRRAGLRRGAPRRLGRDGSGGPLSRGFRAG